MNRFFCQKAAFRLVFATGAMMIGLGCLTSTAQAQGLQSFQDHQRAMDHHQQMSFHNQQIMSSARDHMNSNHGGMAGAAVAPLMGGGFGGLDLGRNATTQERAQHQATLRKARLAARHGLNF